MLENEKQSQRIKELINKYVSFNLMPPQDKSRVMHLCGILAYLEIADNQQMSIKGCIKGLTNFLENIREKYVKDDDSNDGNVILTP